jgi:serine/threonine protein kinase
MDANSPNWRDHFGDPASPDEQAALDAIRRRLPDTGTIAWPNVQFMDNQGNANEVDLILLSPQGLFVVELKGWRGSFTGDQFFWQVTYSGGRREERKNPFGGTRLKAQRLASLLKDAQRQARLPNLHVPHVSAVVVMHGQPSDFTLPGNAAEHIYLLDGYKVKGLPAFGDVIAGTAPDCQPIDPATRAAVAKLFDQVGLRAKPKVRMIGQFKVTDTNPLATGPGWEDYAVDHPHLRGVQRRVRLFPIPPNAPASEQQAIRRTARREFHLTNELNLPGIVSAVEYIDAPDSAPAVVFPKDPAGQVALDRYLAEHASDIDVNVRFRLVQQLAEILQYAHKHGVFHRGLTPSTVRVQPDDGLQISVRDWQTGAVEDAGDGPDPTALAGATQVQNLADEERWVYLAPEAHAIAHPDGRAMDVYGLGALAYLIFTGQPPAENLADLQSKLAAGGLDAASVADQLPDDLIYLIRWATAPSVTDRLATIDDFIDAVTEVQKELAEQQPDPESVTDPLEAQPGDMIQDWLVEASLGKGSTGRALLVSDGTKTSKPFVLKVAVSEDKADALISEADVLETLDHPLVVKQIFAPMTIHGRTCVGIEYAGDTTLARTLREDGRLTLERLETLGADLLEIGLYLSERGINHRDIKPDNLGIRPDPGDRRPRLLIFDFSLSRRPVDDTTSGTRPYLDPFLTPKYRRRAYDSAAERYAIAVSLYEMATGSLPEWGDGQTAPEFADLTLNPDAFEGPRPDEMVAFFAKALAKDAKDRFDDIHTMARAWQKLFVESTTITLGTEVSEQDRDNAAAAATRGTSLVDAGLSARAVSAARRMGAETVGDVMNLDPVAINQTQGVGLRTRQELQKRRRQWLELLADQTWVDDTPDVGRAIENLRAALVPKNNGKNTNAVALATALVDSPDWPSTTQLARRAGLSTSDAVVAAEQLRRHWSRNPALADVAAEVETVLVSGNGISTVSEIATVLLARHGSQLNDVADRLAATVPVIRAAIKSHDADLVLNRAQGSTVLLLGRESDALPDPDAAMQTVRALAELLDEAVADEPGLVPAPTAESLVATDAQQLRLPVLRVLRLAAACSASADVSTRGELYRRGLPAEVTLPRVLHAAGSAVISEKTLRARVASRFPAAAALPPRPALDALVANAMPGMAWDGTNYAKPTAASRLTSSTRYTTLGEMRLADHVGLLARLQDSLAGRSGLVLGVDPRFIDRASSWLHQRYGSDEVALGAELITAAKRLAGTSRVSWDMLRRVDAQHTGPDRARLNQFMARAFDTFWDERLQSEQPLVFTDAAVLARYGLTERLAPLTNLAVAKPAARWILVPHRAAVTYPTLDGTPVPLGADGWLDLPTSLFTQALPKGA